MSQKTLPTGVPVGEFLAGLPDARRREEGARLLAIFAQETGVEGVMWGPSIVGFGEYAYRYSSGHSGVWPRVGFSPRSASISLYGLQDSPDSPPVLERLGRHRTGVGCIYVTRLPAVDEDALREFVRVGWALPR